MIRIQCPKCSKQLSVNDNMAGKAGKCPGCSTVIQIPAAPAAPQSELWAELGDPNAAQQHAPGQQMPGPGGHAPMGQPQMQPGAMPGYGQPQQPAPAQWGGQQQFGGGPQWAAQQPAQQQYGGPPASQYGQYGQPGRVGCPNCGHPDNTRIRWTWWGGLIGPAIINHVRCNHCGTAYNGKSGKSNNTAITIYFVVTLVMALGIVVVCGGLGALAD